MEQKELERDSIRLTNDQYNEVIGGLERVKALNEFQLRSLERMITDKIPNFKSRAENILREITAHEGFYSQGGKNRTYRKSTIHKGRDLPSLLLGIYLLTNKEIINEDKLGITAREVWNKLKKENHSFPDKGEKIAVREMHKRGYDIIKGFVYVNNYCNTDEVELIPSYWNSDPRTEEDFDITASQFNHLFSNERFPMIARRINDNFIYRVIKRNISPEEVV